MSFFRTTLLCAAFLSLGCSILTPLPNKQNLNQRLAAFPTEELPLQFPVTVHWNAFAVPFIEAQSDQDAAFTLGLVHAHLRLGQMEIIRRAATGRLSELFGPFAVEIDQAVRILDLGKAAPQIKAMMPQSTLEWLESFVAGVNYYLATARDLPHEFAVFQLKREPWTVEELITVTRLYSADVTWFNLLRYLKNRGDKNVDLVFSELLGLSGSSTPSFYQSNKQSSEQFGQKPLRELNEVLNSISRSGSNTVAIGAARSTSNAPLLANDPHLGLQFPNIWILAGVFSPNYHAVGLMLPFAPFVAIGRNPALSWGGTNMHAPSSALYRLDSKELSHVKEREEVIKVRLWPDSKFTVRDSRFGPIISDADLFKIPDSSGEIALRWLGHQPSDEITAFLEAGRAQTSSEFRGAFASYRVSAQSMLYATASGDIGLVPAYGLPEFYQNGEKALIREASTEQWLLSGSNSPLSLPHSLNPSSGYLVSANNIPVATEPPLGLFSPPNDRVHRLSFLAEHFREHSVDSLRKIQLDVFAETPAKVHSELLKRLSPNMEQLLFSSSQRVWWQAFQSWDGFYYEDSVGASAFHSLIAVLTPKVIDLWCKAKGYAEALCQLPKDSGSWAVIFLAGLETADDQTLTSLMRTILPRAASDFRRFSTWGDRHTIELSHFLGRIPLIGLRYRFYSGPTSGSSETINKTAHSLSRGGVPTRYGSIARHISDMSDPDLNFFVLFGGQDGWLNSSNSFDQIRLWQEGRLMRFPLTLEGIRKDFPYKLALGSKQTISFLKHPNPRR